MFSLLYSPILMTPGKTIALTIRTFVGKVMFLLFNTLSRFVIVLQILCHSWHQERESMSTPLQSVPCPVTDWANRVKMEVTYVIFRPSLQGLAVSTLALRDGTCKQTKARACIKIELWSTPAETSPGNQPLIYNKPWETTGKCDSISLLREADKLI